MSNESQTGTPTNGLPDGLAEGHKPVLITTQHRGVFFGYVPELQDLAARTMPLRRARMAIYWGTTGGVAQLAETGPTPKSRIGSRADLPAVHDITAVFAVTPEAAAAWEAAK